ncbi:cell division protein SepF [Herbiconiux sp. L3-i23]|uniref:cell division protein SepF n=1 Tax=Herbiconiux sp. L3-i23 TaxID=2905871 RepID=UPI002055C7B9|nr:cell division protein SepF [Herbiconiux sp. L3-i23]BDI22409.1 cell division protein SepF [Herbiconiux sp. L3-i23]
MSNPIRKTMVYLGLADEDYDEQLDAPAAPVQQQPTSAPAQGRATVTALPKRQPRIAAVAPAAEMNEILTVHPRQYKDAQVIAESFREGVPVIINLSQMSETDARRLIDFASGLSQGLYGKIERVTNKVFLLSPAHVAVSGEGAGETDVEAAFTQ